MAKKNGVSSKTHTQKQLNDYANQNNPNNKAYNAKMANQAVMSQSSRKKRARSNNQAKQWAKFESEHGSLVPLGWMCYSNPYDLD